MHHKHEPFQLFDRRSDFNEYISQCSKNIRFLREFTHTKTNIFYINPLNDNILDASSNAKHAVTGILLKTGLRYNRYRAKMDKQMSFIPNKQDVGC
ncbi:MAG: hypothetical protein LZF61_08500 [Nitrosomonas sp.]|nr:MAG: hypothetical protein LZF61_08500 [Nitrosomonas sp.]